MRGSLQKHHFLRKLKNARLSDEEELPSVSLLVKEGDWVLDIGANFGLFTRFLSEAVGETGRVFSFEPGPEMFPVLKNNCLKSGLTNAVPYQLALSDRNGVAEFSIPVRSDGTPNYYEASLNTMVATAGCVKVEVETITLDDFVARENLERIDFIKCDVEGHEIRVLEGARKTLEAFKPSVLLEVNEPLDQPGHGAEVRQLIEELGYAVFVFAKGQISPWKPGDSFVNYVLKPVG